jgi:restriction system protein
MPRQHESFAQLLLRLPWWFGATLGILAFAGLRWGLPVWARQDSAKQILVKGLAPLAPFALVFFGLFAAGSLVFAAKRRRLIDQQTSLDSLRQISWKEFEYLVAELYRRQGYRVDYSLGCGADGGVDLTLHKDGQKSIVQCKRWNAKAVNASVVREMFGLMVAESAGQVIIITTGNFTADAQAFAAGKPIHLIDGLELLPLVQSVQNKYSETDSQASPAATDSTPPACPLCSKPMVQRVARRGSNAGRTFWGCSAYPACKGTRD